MFSASFKIYNKTKIVASYSITIYSYSFIFTSIFGSGNFCCCCFQVDFQCDFQSLFCYIIYVRIYIYLLCDNLPAITENLKKIAENAI